MWNNNYYDMMMITNHHPKSPYKLSPPNFALLMKLYPELFGQYFSSLRQLKSHEVNQSLITLHCSYVELK